MKRQLRFKHRLRVDINLALYSSLMLIIMSILFMMVIPVLRQPTPLHELAQIRNHTGVMTPTIISLSDTGDYQLNTEMNTEASLDLETLKALLLKQFKLMPPQKTSICIKANPDVPYGKILDLLEWLQTQEARHVGLLTHSPTAAKAIS